MSAVTRSWAPRALAAIVAVVGQLACAPGRIVPFPDRAVLWADDDRRPLRRAPEPFRRGLISWTLHTALLQPVQRVLGGGALGPSRNVNALDEVPDSAWFTNRHHLRPRSAAELRRGAATGPAPRPPWIVERVSKDPAGVGVIVRDDRRDRYLLRFDARKAPHLSTSASMVATLLLHALGYHVPERWLLELTPSTLRETRETRWAGVSRRARRRAKAPSTLAALLRGLPLDRLGRLRAVATRLPDAKDLGPFLYRSRRADDPNDFVHHERRRELRGLRPVAAWLNLVGITHEAPRDLFLRGRRRYVRHTLWELRGALGSRVDGTAKRLAEGSAPRLDVAGALRQLFTLGGSVPRWALLANRRAWLLGRWPGIGWYDGSTFRPEGWTPTFWNDAFSRARPADLFWGARLVASLDAAQLGAIVAQARLPDPARRRLLEVLLERRRKVLRMYLGQHAPLDRLAIRRGTPPRLCAVDLWRRERLDARARPRYEARSLRLDGSVLRAGLPLTRDGDRLCLELGPATARQSSGDTYAVYELRRTDVSSRWVQAHVRDGARLVGIVR